jgi:hypothetical protein
MAVLFRKIYSGLEQRDRSNFGRLLVLAEGVPKHTGPIAVMLHDHGMGRTYARQIASHLDGAVSGGDKDHAWFFDKARPLNFCSVTNLPAQAAACQ